MRILVFHGYMLRGTGSNIYTANLTRALAALGHEVPEEGCGPGEDARLGGHCELSQRRLLP